MRVAGELTPCRRPTTRQQQTINDWYDRDIDAINEPYRPIPSGRITEPQVRAHSTAQHSTAASPLPSSLPSIAWP